MGLQDIALIKQWCVDTNMDRNAPHPNDTKPILKELKSAR
jgi:hypothetical protein